MRKESVDGWREVARLVLVGLMIGLAIVALIR